MQQARDSIPRHPALACLEFNSIARGMCCCDEMCKRAAIRVLEAATLCPGKFLVVIGGEEEAVLESYRKGLEHGGACVIDHLYLPQAHQQLMPAIEAVTSPPAIKAVGIVETYAVASAILAADAACKRAEISLIELRLARGLGGKAFFTCTGELYDIEPAIEAAKNAVASGSGLLARTEIIARPHAEFCRWLS